jgi:hypothetical protein
MSYTTTLDSSIIVNDAFGTHNIEFRLPTTELRSISPVQTPFTFTALLEPAEVWSLDCSNLGDTIRLVAFKSSRPIRIKLINSIDEEYVMPYSTYLEYLLDTSEEVAETLKTIEVTVAAEPVTAPTQRPARYPNALLELFILTQ